MLERLRQTLAEQGMVSFSLRVRPGAAKNRIVAVMDDGSVKVEIAAAAEDGKANAELRAFLADEFNVVAGHVEILAGDSGRRKIVRVTR